MTISQVILVLIYYTTFVYTAHIPQYMKVCKKRDPNLKECIKRSGQDAVPYLFKGEKTLQIPQLDPLYITKINVDATKNLNMQLENLTITGLKETRILDDWIDVDKMQTWIEVFVPTMRIIGDYHMDGSILILPVYGRGRANITFVDGIYKFWFNWKLIHKKGVEFAHITEHGMSAKFKRAYYYFGNVFNGDKMMGEMINKFLDENWKEFTNDFGPAISKALGDVINYISKGIYQNVPYKEIFLD